MTVNLQDRIYEAAFTPEFWPDVLDRLAAMSGSVGGALLVSGSRHAPRFAASEALRGAVETFCSGQDWSSGKHPPRWQGGQGEFARDVDFFDAEELDADPIRRALISYGLGWETGTVIAMPDGEVVVFAVDRRFDDGPHDATVLSGLNAVRPHLARAGLVAARLGLERAIGTVAAMDALGLPAAVLTASGRVLAANALMERMPTIFISRARDRMALPTDAASQFLHEALADNGAPGSAMVRSFPIAATLDRPSVVVHAVPLRRSAHDIFSGGDMLIAATTANGAASLIPARILTGLFDLTAAESRLASRLAGGKPLKACAAELGVAFSTARSYLERILRKTGTHGQVELVALLNGMPRFPAESANDAALRRPETGRDSDLP